jgi:hypothetical protein
MGRLLRGGLYQQTTRLWCTTAFLITETLEEFCPALDPFAVLTVSSLARWLAGWPRSACCVRRHRGHGALLSVFRPGLPIAAACFCPRGEASSCCDRPCLVFVGTGGARGGGGAEGGQRRAAHAGAPVVARAVFAPQTSYPSCGPGQRGRAGPLRHRHDESIHAPL